MLDLPVDIKNKIARITDIEACPLLGSDKEKHGKSCWVARPENAQELSRLVKFCADHRIAMRPLSGDLENMPARCMDMLAVSMEKLNKITELDSVACTVTVEAGCTLDDVRRAADEAGFILPFYLNASGETKIGSCLALNVIRTGAFRYGSPKELTLGLSLVLPDGTMKDCLKNYANSEADTMKNLFIGSRGKIGFITGATLKLYPKPVDIQRMLCGLDSLSGVSKLFALSQHFGATLLTGFDVFSMNGLNLMLARDEFAKNPMKKDFDWYALIEFSSTVQNSQVADFLSGLKKEAVQKGLIADALIAEESGLKEDLALLKGCFSSLSKPPKSVVSYEAVVPVSRLTEMMERLCSQMQYFFPDNVFIPFARLGDGSLFLNVKSPLSENAELVLTNGEKLFTLFNEAAKQSGGALVEKEEMPAPKHPLSGMTEAMDMFRAVKSSFDPYGLMSPEK